MYSRQRSTLRMKSAFSVLELTVAWAAGAGAAGGGGHGRLEGARRLVGEEADSAAGEARQACPERSRRAIFHAGEPEPRQLPFDLQQRVFALTPRRVGAGAGGAG